MNGLTEQQPGLNPNRSEPIAAFYVHVPFCRRKCAYCDFYSRQPRAADFANYFRGVREELQTVLTEIGQADLDLHPLRSVYFGGGTPSLLPADQLDSLLSLFRREVGLAPNCEITLEANPGCAGVQDPICWRQSGFNRISIGYQAKQDRLLKVLGRIHRYADFAVFFERLSLAGFDNISCDLMFGLPTQTLADVAESLKDLIGRRIPHISFYALGLEEGTPFFQRYREHPELLPAESLEREMYHLIVACLEKVGYENYEISNAARPGFHSRHNTVYWRTTPYIGLGPAAHSYFGGIRRANPASLDEWLTAPGREKNQTRELIDFAEAMREYALLAFRLADGLSETSFRARFSRDFPTEFVSSLDKLAKRQLICKQADRYCLTALGRDLANQVFVEFV